MPKNRVGRGVTSILLWLPAIGLLGVTVLGFLGSWWWIFDLFSHYRFQYMVLAGLALLVAIILRRFWLSIPPVAVLLINGLLLAPLWTGSAQTSEDGVGFRVVMFNVLMHNPEHEAVASWLLEQQAEVMVLQETGQIWADQLDIRLEGYQRVEMDTVREDAFGIMVFLRDGLNVIDATAEEDPAGKPLATIRFVVDGREATLITGHPRPPMAEWSSRFRGWQLLRIGKRVNESETPVLVMGDLNATRWSAPLRRLLRETELRDSSEGFGYQGTWPSDLWWTGMIPIDHVLVGPEFRVDDRRVGPALGSDHRAVVVDLTLAPPQ